MADNEHSTAPLGDSEESSVENAPRQAVPEVGQRCENDPEVASVGSGEEPRDVFKQDPAGAASVKLICDPVCPVEEEAGPAALDSGALPGDGPVLAGDASDDKIHRLRLSIRGLIPAGSNTRIASPMSSPGVSSRIPDAGANNTRASRISGAESPFPDAPLCAFNGAATVDGAPLPFLAYRASNVVGAGDIGPMPREDAPPPRIGLALPDHPKSSPLQSEIKAPHSAEERRDIHARPLRFGLP